MKFSHFNNVMAYWARVSGVVSRTFEVQVEDTATGFRAYTLGPWLVELGFFDRRARGFYPASSSWHGSILPNADTANKNLGCC